MTGVQTCALPILSQSMPPRVEFNGQGRNDGKLYKAVVAGDLKIDLEALRLEVFFKYDQQLR